MKFSLLPGRVKYNVPVNVHHLLHLKGLSFTFIQTHGDMLISVKHGRQMFGFSWNVQHAKVSKLKRFLNIVKA